MQYDLRPIAEEYPFTPKKINLDGIEMSYLDEGEKSAPTIVMVHGNPTWSFYYRKLVLALRDQYRVIVPDHIGCGLSDKPQEYDYTLANHINNLDRLLDTVAPTGKIILVLHDWGGAIGMGSAIKNPEKIAGLVIFNTAAFLSTRIPFRISICRTPMIGELIVKGFNGFVGPAVNLGMGSAKPERFTEMIKKGYLLPYNSWKNRIAIHRFVKDIPLSPSHESYDTLKNIDEKIFLFENRPSLLVWGKKDFCFTEHFMDMWQDRLKFHETHSFDDVGHFVVEDAWEKIVPIMKNYMTRIGF